MAQRTISRSLSVNAAAFFSSTVVTAFASSDPSPAHHLVQNRNESMNISSLVRSPPRRTCLQYALCEKTMPETETKRFKNALANHRSQISSYRQKWEYKADSSATTATKTPSRSWPDDVPSDEELSLLLHEVKYCDRSPKLRSDKDYCRRLSFRVASALVMQFDDVSQKRGLNIIKNLAEKGHPDAMVYYGVCLNEGRLGMDPNSGAAVSWFKRCAEMYEHPQSLYELGVAFYTGEGVVEDEEEAVRLFRAAAEQKHPAACYMLGDCLFDGIGVEVDRELALEWLVKAGELGHRGARSRVMAVLEKKEGIDYGGFTDASRQSLAEHTIRSTTKDGQINRRKKTLRKDASSESRNPTELVRRQTIVNRSRELL